MCISKQRALQLPHDISIASVVKEHVVKLLDGLHLDPLALLDQLLVDLVVVEEEVVEAFVAVSNVPRNQTPGLHNSQQLSKCLNDEMVTVGLNGL